MTDLYDRSAIKKATNLTVNSDLLEKSRTLRINLSATLEKALVAELQAAEAEQWKKKNRPAIQAYNEFVAEHGCFGDEYREF
jgi:antitoxin CcdA